MRPGKLETHTSTPKRYAKVYGGSAKQFSQGELTLSRFIGTEKVWVGATGLTPFNAADLYRALDAVMQDGPPK